MRQYHNSHLSFIDTLFNALVVFAALFVLTVMIINDPTHATKTVDAKAKILITMTWEDTSADDMDLSLLTPEPAKIAYNNKDGGAIANLTRDDLGLENDFYVDADGKTHYIHLNKEVIEIRQTMPGHYEVDVCFYARKLNPETSKFSVGPQEVTVQITEIDPAYHEVTTVSVKLNEEHEVKTVVAFDIVDGRVINVDTHPEQDDFLHRDIGGQQQ